MFRCRVLAFESAGDFKRGQQLEGVVAAVMAVEVVFTEFRPGDRIAVRQEQAEIERLPAERHKDTTARRHIQRRKVCGQQRVDGSLVPSCLVRLPSGEPNLLPCESLGGWTVRLFPAPS